MNHWWLFDLPVTHGLSNEEYDVCKGVIEKVFDLFEKRQLTTTQKIVAFRSGVKLLQSQIADNIKESKIKPARFRLRFIQGSWVERAPQDISEE